MSSEVVELGRWESDEAVDVNVLERSGGRQEASR